MNKLLTTIIATSVAFMTFAGTANSIEFKVGVTGQSSAYYAKLEETMKDNGRRTDKEAAAAFKYMSGFAEVAFDEAYGIALGVEYSPESIVLEKADRVITPSISTGGSEVGNDSGTQEIGAEFKDLLNVYVAVPIMGTGFNVKAGLTSVKLITKETLATGSTYGNKTLNGATLGAFYDGEIGSNFFYRVEGAYQTFDDFSMRGSEAGLAGNFNKIEAEMSGIAAKLSVGVQF